MTEGGIIETHISIVGRPVMKGIFPAASIASVVCLPADGAFSGYCAFKKRPNVIQQSYLGRRYANIG